MTGKRNPERDERVRLPLDPETALRGLLAVDPEDEPVEPDDTPAADPADEDKKPQGR